MKEFNRPLEHILNYYQKYVKPAFEEFCLPTKKYADVIIPRGAENTVALNLIVQHINDYLNASRTPNNSNLTIHQAHTPEQNTMTTTTNFSEPVLVKTSFESPKSSTVSSLMNSSRSPQSSQSSSPSTPSKRGEISTRPH